VFQLFTNNLPLPLWKEVDQRPVNFTLLNVVFRSCLECSGGDSTGRRTSDLTQEVLSTSSDPITNYDDRLARKQGTRREQWETCKKCFVCPNYHPDCGDLSCEHFLVPVSQTESLAGQPLRFEWQSDFQKSTVLGVEPLWSQIDLPLSPLVSGSPTGSEPLPMAEKRRRGCLAGIEAAL
jgi:hypothetical protein